MSIRGTAILGGRHEGISSPKLDKKHQAITSIEGRVDHLITTSRLSRALKCTGVALSLVALGLAVNILQLLTIPVNFFSRSFAHKLNSYATQITWALTDYLVRGQGNVQLSTSGLDGIPVGESAFVISNHAFFGDFFLINSLAREKSMMAYCRYFLKDSIKYIPIFGWGMYLCNMPFLKRNWQRDSQLITDSLGIFINHRLPVWLVSHVEGSRICPPKLELSQNYARANRLPVLENVLLPRCKGFVATIKALRGSHIEHVYDITLAYYHRRRGFGATPSLFEVITGGLDDYQFHAHIDRMSIGEVPLAEEEANEWLYDIYAKKDTLLGQIRSAFEGKNIKYE